ncbi:Bug family tripartite tricarboxylate transporter substrate binding protein [Agilicoccus flavus]|uniref:Bug family tripartite tricarboxylate transporter substrate binding protein n=1 Tax=Agilicoccus flavus TaxID=2775968 RepID=UPI0027DA3121|nr:tripartite tricarboxylate transporter substrate binding protein [Agilicoccus flavus]
MTSLRLGLRTVGALAVTSLALSACGGVKTSTGGGGGDASATYPSGNIEMSVGASAGGSSDLISRALSTGMGKELGVSMPVINKPGANGALVAKELKGAKPDGSKIAVQNASLFAITPLAVSEAEVTKIEDFDVIYGVSIDDYVMVTNPKSGYKTLADVKAAGKNIKYGTTGVGTGAQLASALTFKTAGVNATPVPFDGGAPNLTAVLGNQVDASTLQVGEAVENIKSGKLVPLAVFSGKRVTYLPEVKTARSRASTSRSSSTASSRPPRVSRRTSRTPSSRRRRRRTRPTPTRSSTRRTTSRRWRSRARRSSRGSRPTRSATRASSTSSAST